MMRRDATAQISEPPLISIVLPTFNGERYLRESLDSCLKQTYPHWELVIVDDASTDATGAIISEYARGDVRVRHVRHEVNRRLPAALNTGFARCRGSLLTWTSDDNRFHPDALTHMARHLVEHSEISVVYTDFVLIDQTGGQIAVQRVATPERLLSGDNMIPSFLFRRAVYERVGQYADDLFLAEDFDYWLRISCSGFVMEPLHEVLYDYRLHPYSLTDENKQRAFHASEQALLRHMSRLAHLLPPRRLDMGRAYVQLSALARWQGANQRSLNYLAQALRYAPLPTVRNTLLSATRRITRLTRVKQAADQP
jgi:glycosyltransferase involved in cell wall biosynthesis